MDPAGDLERFVSAVEHRTHQSPTQVEVTTTMITGRIKQGCDDRNCTSCWIVYTYHRKTGRLE